jgi:copper(I)-binding protein
MINGTPGRPHASVPQAMVLAAVAIVVLAGGVAFLLASGSGDDPAASVQGGAVVRDAWTTEGDSAVAVYLTIENRGGDDELLGASSDAASSVQLMGGNVDMTAAGGAAGTPRLVVPTGETVLAPGGNHLMLVGLTGPLSAGSSLPLRLDLRGAGPVRTQVEVVTPEEATERGG